jgi:hypothetical protein
MQKINTPFEAKEYLVQRTYLESRVGNLSNQVRGDILRTSTDVVAEPLEQWIDPNTKHVQLIENDIDLTPLKALGFLANPNNVIVPVGSISCTEPVTEPLLSQPFEDPFAFLAQESIDAPMEFNMDVYAVPAETIVVEPRAQRKRVEPDRYRDDSFSEGEAEDNPDAIQKPKRQKKLKKRFIECTPCSKKDIDALSTPTIFDFWGHPSLKPLMKDSKTLLPPPPCPDFLSLIPTTPIEESPDFKPWILLQRAWAMQALVVLGLSKSFPMRGVKNPVSDLGDRIREYCEQELPKSIYCGGELSEFRSEEPSAGKLFPDYGDHVPVLLYVLKYQYLEYVVNGNKCTVRLSNPIPSNFPREHCFNTTPPSLHQILCLWWAISPASLIEEVAVIEISKIPNLKEDKRAARKYRKELLADNSPLMKAMAKKSFYRWSLAVAFTQSTVAEEFFNQCKPELPKHYQSSGLTKGGRPILKY